MEKWSGEPVDVPSSRHRRPSTPVNIVVTQHFATSDDGTAIPYFVVGPLDATARAQPCWAATAASRSARTPGYAGVLGRLWLARGGSYVLANIRGGGEYGPRGTPGDARGRHLVSEDFAAVARIWSRAASPPPSSSAHPAAAPGGC